MMGLSASAIAVGNATPTPSQANMAARFSNGPRRWSRFPGRFSGFIFVTEHQSIPALPA